ncbi:MAG TPA: XRE family transcriptional regulator [Streptosporangiaceae bacterium]|jgi:transcriptional regulator with XRE-family HTH domain
MASVQRPGAGSDPLGAGEPADQAEPGTTLRALREQRALTIASLARQVGISAAAISQIESGTVQPSVTTLRKLAAALGVPVFRFFLPADAAAASLVRRGERKTLGLARTGARYELLTPSLQGRLEVMEITMDPGQASAPERISHPGEECLVIIKGHGVLELGDDIIDMRTGDAATFQASLPHRLRNAGQRPLSALSAITPPAF